MLSPVRKIQGNQSRRNNCAYQEAREINPKSFYQFYDVKGICDSAKQWLRMLIV